MAGKANPRFEQALAFAAPGARSGPPGAEGDRLPVRRPPCSSCRDPRPVRVQRGRDRGGISPRHDRRHGRHRGGDQRNLRPALAGLVTSVSEPDKSLPWKTRKQHTIEHLEQEAGSGRARAVAADKLDNVRAITDTLRHLGPEKTWALFKADPERAALLPPAHRGDSPAEGSEQPTVQDADFETQTLFPDQGHSTSLLRREALPRPS